MQNKLVPMQNQATPKRYKKEQDQWFQQRNAKSYPSLMPSRQQIWVDEQEQNEHFQTVCKQKPSDQKNEQTGTQKRVRKNLKTVDPQEQICKYLSFQSSIIQHCEQSFLKDSKDSNQIQEKSEEQMVQSFKIFQANKKIQNICSYESRQMVQEPVQKVEVKYKYDSPPQDRLYQEERGQGSFKFGHLGPKFAVTKLMWFTPNEKNGRTLAFDQQLMRCVPKFKCQGCMKQFTVPSALGGHLNKCEFKNKHFTKISERSKKIKPKRNSKKRRARGYTEVKDQSSEQQLVQRGQLFFQDQPLQPEMEEERQERINQVKVEITRAKVEDTLKQKKSVHTDSHIQTRAKKIKHCGIKKVQ